MLLFNRVVYKVVYIKVNHSMIEADQSHIASIEATFSPWILCAFVGQHAQYSPCLSNPNTCLYNLNRPHTEFPVSLLEGEICFTLAGEHTPNYCF